MVKKSELKNKRISKKCKNGKKGKKLTRKSKTNIRKGKNKVS